MRAGLPSRLLPLRILCLVALAWIGTTELALAETRPDPVATMTEVAHDLDLQTQLPKDIEPPKEETHWSDVHWHIPGGFAQMLLYGALAVAVGFALFALRDTFPRLSRRARVKRGATAVILPNTESVERMQEAGDDADALARQGRLAEAMHMLLLRSLIELRRRLDVTIADSLTSREILQRLTLPERGRLALADLIQRVEFVHFGRRLAAPEDYNACRASYERLIGAMSAALT